MTIFIGQVIFYASAVVLPTAYLLRFLLSSSAAVLVAWWKFLAGEKFVAWEPTPRTQTARR